MIWDDEPATEQQLIRLRNAGCTVDRPLSRTEAARLIRAARNHPGEVLETPPVQSALTSAPRHTPAPAPLPQSHLPGERDIGDATRMHAFRLREEAEHATRALAANPAGPNVRADAAGCTAARREFWIDTCREFKDMRVASKEVFELYQNYGCRFFAPDSQHVQEILDALDAAMPSWDRDHPELLYQALELNLPHLLRRM